MKKKVKVGVIGVGLIAQLAHIPAYQEAGAEVVAICDIVEERAKKVAEKFSISRIYTDYKQLLSDPDIEAVSICTPNYLHAQMTIDALESSKHVLCEKPMAVNAKEAEAMLKAARKSEKILMMGFNNRFRGDAQKLKQFIDSGKLGEIYYARVGYMRRRGTPRGWFTVKAESGGGPVVDIGVHIIDLTRYLMGNPKPVSVFATTYKKFPEYHLDGRQTWDSSDVRDGLRDGKLNDVEDLATAMIKFDNGATMFVEVAWAANISGDKFYVNLCGTKAGVELDSYNPIHKGARNNDALLKLFGEEMNSLVDYYIDPPKVKSHFEEIKYFLSCVKENKQPETCKAEDGVEIQKILDAIYESAETGKLINL